MGKRRFVAKAPQLLEDEPRVGLDDELGLERPSDLAGIHVDDGDGAARESAAQRLPYHRSQAGPDGDEQVGALVQVGVGRRMSRSADRAEAKAVIVGKRAMVG